MPHSVHRQIRLGLLRSTSLVPRVVARFGVDKTSLKIQADPAFFNLYTGVLRQLRRKNPCRFLNMQTEIGFFGRRNLKKQTKI